ncbi:MAG: TonB-dependent receptor [Dysgonamonadaceae bacterium]|nr:TonB-dependent receptor [Dysgonamonadaceae bacterium]
MLFPGFLFAQRVKITGIVSDPSGLPVELASVQERGTINGTFTDEKGKYSLQVSTKDSLTLVFSCLGYNTTQVNLPVPEKDAVLNVRMRMETYDLEGVVVTANAFQANTMEKINTKQMRLSVDATGGSIESRIITAGIGVSSTNELSSQYSVRGGNYNENIVYVNGIEVYRPLLIRNAQQEGMSFINPDLAESVRFSSGGFDARYGDKMSSVLDVIYKTPEKLEGGVMGSMLGGNIYLGSVAGKFSQITGFRYKRGTTLLKTLDTKGDYNPLVMDVQTYMNYSFTPKVSLSFMGNYSDNVYDFNPSTRETSFGTMDAPRKFMVYYDGKERDRFRTLFGAAILKYAISEHANISLQLSALQSREEETYDIAGEYWISNVLEQGEENIGTGLFHQHARDFLNAEVFNASIVGDLGIEQHAVHWSLGVQKELIKDRNNEWELRDSAGYSLPFDEKILTMYSNLLSMNRIESNRYSGHIQDTYKFRIKEGMLYLTAGIRGSYWDYNKEFVFSPRVSVGFIPSKYSNITLRFATGLYYQTPFYKELRVIETNEDNNSVVVLNKNIKSQRSIHFVLGGDYGFKFDNRIFKFTAEMYYKKLDNLIPYTVDNVKVWYYGANTSNGYATGIDTKLFGQFVQGTDSWIGLSLMQAKQYIDGVKVSMPTDQLYNFTFFFTEMYKRFQANVRIIWAAGLPFSVPGYKYKAGLTAPPYRRVDFGISYCLLGENDMDSRNPIGNYFRNIWIGGDIFNLFDIKNVSSYSWFTDVNGYRNAVPDRLTGRQINVKLIVEF